jgi:hypothetical protein
VGHSLEFYLTPWGFLKGAARTTRRLSRRGGKTVLSWSPTVKAPSGKAYVINGYLNDKNLVEQVETWLGENIMGDMHIVATYSGMEGLRRHDGAVEDRADARRLAVFRSERRSGQGQSARPRRTGSGTATACRTWWRRPGACGWGRTRRRRTCGPPALPSRRKSSATACTG